MGRRGDKAHSPTQAASTGVVLNSAPNDNIQVQKTATPVARWAASSREKQEQATALQPRELGDAARALRDAEPHRLGDKGRPEEQFLLQRGAGGRATTSSCRTCLLAALAAVAGRRSAATSRRRAVVSAASASRRGRRPAREWSWPIMYDGYRNTSRRRRRRRGERRAEPRSAAHRTPARSCSAPAPCSDAPAPRVADSSASSSRLRRRADAARDERARWSNEAAVRKAEAHTSKSSAPCRALPVDASSRRRWRQLRRAAQNGGRRGELRGARRRRSRFGARSRLEANNGAVEQRRGFASGPRRSASRSARGGAGSSAIHCGGRRPRRVEEVQVLKKARVGRDAAAVRRDCSPTSREAEATAAPRGPRWLAHRLQRRQRAPAPERSATFFEQA